MAVGVYFIVKSESKISPGTDFVAEDMKENILEIFVYIAANFRIAGKCSNNKKFKYNSNIQNV